MAPFDPDSFMHNEVTGESSTVFVPAPAGSHKGVIGEGIKFRAQPSKDGSETYHIADIPWKLDDPDGKIAELIGRNPSSRQSIFLDLTPEGNMDMGKGKNVQLGLLREAVGQNKPGEKWAFSKLIGRPARILIEHKKDGEGDAAQIRANVTKVTKL